MSRERLSKGVRKYNRFEKAAARAAGREPVLIVRPVIAPHRTVELQSETPMPISSFTPMTEPTPITQPVKQVIRKPPSMNEIMSAGSRLSMACRGFDFDIGDKQWEYITDDRAVEILKGLANGIETGRILSQEEIAREVGRLGPKMGPLGSVSTEIDRAALGVIYAIRANMDRLKK